MSIKFVLAISFFCCVFPAAINAQSQPFDDINYEIAKARDRYMKPVPLPTPRPQNQQPDNSRNAGHTPVRSQTTPRPQSQQQDNQRNLQQGNPPQNSRQLGAIYYYANFSKSVQRQEFSQHSKCMSILCLHQETFRSENFRMNTLAADIPDRFTPSQP